MNDLEKLQSLINLGQLPWFTVTDDECVQIWWVNPWSKEKERVAMLMWPGHPIEETARVEAWYSTLGKIVDTCSPEFLGRLFKKLQAYEEFLEMIADFETQHDAFAKTYNRVHVDCNYPKPKSACELLAKYKESP